MLAKLTCLARCTFISHLVLVLLFYGSQYAEENEKRRRKEFSTPRVYTAMRPLPPTCIRRAGEGAPARTPHPASPLRRAATQPGARSMPRRGFCPQSRSRLVTGRGAAQTRAGAAPLSRCARTSGSWSSLINARHQQQLGDRGLAPSPPPTLLCLSLSLVRRYITGHQRVTGFPGARGAWWPPFRPRKLGALPCYLFARRIYVVISAADASGTPYSRWRGGRYSA